MIRTPLQRPTTELREVAGRARETARNSFTPGPHSEEIDTRMILSLALEVPSEARRLQRQAQLIG
eukprot:10846199-Alexandrium_andersonii.AAC.1